MSFPRLRPRRLRRLGILRDMTAETRLDVRDLVTPLFFREGIVEPEPIESMPGYYRYPVEHADRVAGEVADLGIGMVLVFGIPREKDPRGSSAYRRDGVVQKAVRIMRETLGSRLVVATDVCMCQYTDHGHCGVVRRDPRCIGGGECWYVDNDETIKVLGRIAVSHAEAGADIVAPSSMMDGMVYSIRRALDEEGFENVAIMSYSAKYSSGFYGPFRDAAHSAPRFGDRSTYQMDPRNAFEALKEVRLDVGEGADILMVKPALPYLDVIRLVKDSFPEYPLAAYNVSGEYGMVKAAAEKGWVDERGIVVEILTSIKRAGADLIISYHSLDVARWLREP